MREQRSVVLHCKICCKNNLQNSIVFRAGGGKGRENISGSAIRIATNMWGKGKAPGRHRNYAYNAIVLYFISFFVFFCWQCKSE